MQKPHYCSVDMTLHTRKTRGIDVACQLVKHVAHNLDERYHNSHFAYNKHISPITCHHPPTPHNILINRCLMADTVWDFTHPAISALLAGYRSISAYHIKGPYHPKIHHFCCVCILMLFTAVQQQPYPCTTARLPLGNSNTTVAQR